LLLVTFHSVIELNASSATEPGSADPARLELSFVPLCVYLLVVAGLTVWMTWRFRRPA
jgi:hypothetical protein